MNRPSIAITADMLAYCNDERLHALTVNRTKASPIDTLAGALGEMVWAQYRYGDWRVHNLEDNKGKADFADVEIKTSAFPFSERLHLLVREDYAQKRKPRRYVLVIIDISSPKAPITAGVNAYICGFATAREVDNAPLKDFGSKFGKEGGYRCHYIAIDCLHPITEFDSVLL